MKQTCQTRPARGESRKKKLRRKHAAQALAAATAIAGGTQAYASPVRYVNPAHGETGHFHWPAPSGIDTSILNVTFPPSDQPVDAAGGFRHFIPTGYTDRSRVAGRAGGQMQIDGSGYFVAGVDSGVLIPSGTAWGSDQYIYYPGYGSELPEGQQTYLGVRFDLGSGSQYGWIGVVRTGIELDAFAWGYETEPGVPIGAGAIPEPGTLAMLAVGVAAMAGRRRRSAE